MCLLLTTHIGYSQIYNTEIEAKINMESNTEFISITGSAFNKTEFSQSVRYVLSVIKNDPQSSNRSKNDQSGRIVLDAGQKSNLSSTTINAGDTDRIIILLLIYDLENNLKGKDRIVINGTEADNKEQALKEEKELNLSPDAQHDNSDGVFLRGIVLEETKTKPGRDFFKEFSSLYQNNNLNGREVVTVKEELALANNTKIQILVANEVIFEFFVRPQTDFLKQAATESIRRVFLHFKYLEESKDYVRRF
ncbi:CsgE family curli-type amyloid fiber assembly protein [Constantimarinum furrinae]|uniref:Curli production assembly/transport component CsgE n=1 Tax=Constantimarinum furrinae TaxID=2562285 RepID=A0A7G8PR31_9FLAO|nr:CsgE family curli-type amyloid fiber assembly protein [Constantimarinum furrinae]QNJ96797.1 Curli assembly protein CsgE [Constantimarinum furrinae]